MYDWQLGGWYYESKVNKYNDESRFSEEFGGLIWKIRNFDIPTGKSRKGFSAKGIFDEKMTEVVGRYKAGRGIQLTNQDLEDIALRKFRGREEIRPVD